MDNLPPELLRAILLSSVHLSRSEKNTLLPLRLVNKRFDFILREYMFKTVQLDFSRFARGETAPQMSSLADVGHLCQSLYCDMMVIRDEGTATLYLATYPCCMSCHSCTSSVAKCRTAKRLPCCFNDSSRNLLI
jgi:hypothetical protein